MKYKIPQKDNMNSKLISFILILVLSTQASLFCSQHPLTMISQAIEESLFGSNEELKHPLFVSCANEFEDYRSYNSITCTIHAVKIIKQVENDYAQTSQSKILPDIYWSIENPEKEAQRLLNFIQDRRVSVAQMILYDLYNIAHKK